MKVRKITNIIAILLIVFCVSIITIDKFSKKERPNTLFYSIDEKRYLNSSEDYKIRVYAYEDIDLNYADIYFKDSRNLIKVDILKLDQLGNTFYNNFQYNIYDIYVINEDKFKYKEIIIDYNDESYLLEINQNILNTNLNNLLDYNYLNGHFAYINNNLLLIGISIELNEDITVKKISLNDDIYVINNLIEEKKIEDNIITEIHDYTLSDFNNYSLSKNKRYYLPLGYKKLDLVVSNKIDFDNLSILTLDFLNSPRELKDFNSFINRSTSYARN